MGSVVALPITVGLSLISTNPSDFVTYFKWLYAYCYLAIYRWFTKNRFDIYDVNARNDPIKSNFLVPQKEFDLESPRSEAELEQGTDEIFFYGVNSKSECLVVRIARSTNHQSEAWIYLKMKDGKVFKLHKTIGYQNSCSDGGKEYTCGGLKVHYNAPMRRWRIFYNGMLKETSEDNPDSGKLVYVKFAFLWRASSDAFDMTYNVNSAALALGFAKTKWKTFKPPLETLNEALNFYAQSGSIFGTVSVDGESADREMYVFGERFRFLGSTVSVSGTQFVHIMGQMYRDGTIVHIAEATIPGVVEKLRFGFLVFPTGELVSISDPYPQLETKSKEEVMAVFNAKGFEFKLKGKMAGRLSRFESNKGWDGSLTIDCLTMRMNGFEGNGVLLKGEILKSSRRSILLLNLKHIPKEPPLALHFSEDLCEVAELTGGKGSSLGKLSQLSKMMQSFIVPNGIVVTTAAYETFVNKEIETEIRSLEEVLYGNSEGDVKESCQKVMDEVVKANIPDVVLQAVVKCLQKAFGEQLHTKKFAVRSSATGEDTEQMSAAGQMETFLGISGLSEIMSAVKKCWASQFGFVAVQYKRKNGQLLNSPMAVVIQEMVPCDVAGVLFTCDPLTGNPTLMSITANYGIGESVVSGSEEPDSLVLKRIAEDKLEIKEKAIGAKSHKIVITDNEGTSLENVTEAEKHSCCVSDANALRLGSIALQIERSYRSHRDIEWGFWNNNLYIFQSRPVTSGTGETDFEIDHELDLAMRCENEYFTVCNVGEVMPGAMSPLGLDVLFKHFFLSFQRNNMTQWYNNERTIYHHKVLTYMYQHAMFYALDLLEQIHEGREIIEASMVGLYGRVLDDEEIFEAALDRFRTRKSQSSIFKNYILFKGLFTVDGRFKKAQQFYANYHVPVEKLKDSKKVFDRMMHACDDIVEAFNCHLLATQNSSIWNMMIMNIIGKARGGIGINSDVYRDLSKLLSSISGVESAGVPCAMQSLAYHIGKEVSPEDFKKRDPEEIVRWLKTSPSEAGIKFREFLKDHGHRCLREFDLISTTWGANPKLLIELLQNLVGNVSEDASAKKVETADQMLNSLGIPLKFSTRLLLKYFMLSKCRKGVQTREHTKSQMIKLINCLRRGYRHLAKVMVSEGRIPDEDLLFFMHVDEIRELLTNRSPKIISKALHRRRRFPVLDKYIFPEIEKGFPRPVNAEDAPVILNEENFKMHGIPVSQGVTKGFVRVALTLEEASHLKHGEILLTYSTDIGWTPYFPSLAGVVTELGGLISHGAVVSREYGLPCIAGLHGATRQFQTGDYVLLDGNKGILQKLAPPQ